MTRRCFRSEKSRNNVLTTVAPKSAYDLKTLTGGGGVAEINVLGAVIETNGLISVVENEPFGTRTVAVNK